MWLLITVIILFILVLSIALLVLRKTVVNPPTLDFSDRQKLLSSPYFAFEPVLTPAVQWFDRQSWQALDITAADGTELHGLWLPKKGSNTALLLFHGYASMPHNDFCLTARWAVRQGYSVFAAYQRHYAPSGGGTTAMGLLEAEDCRLWAEKISAMLGSEAKLVLGGVSMGASTVLFAADKQLPDSVRAIVADCGYQSVKAIVKSILRTRLHIRTFPLLQLACLYGRIRWGVWPGAVDTTLIMERAKIPVFFAHGKEDRLVPFEMTQKAYDACTAPKHLFVSEHAGHSTCALVETERYFTELEQFLAPLLK